MNTKTQDELIEEGVETRKTPLTSEATPAQAWRTLATLDVSRQIETMPEWKKDGKVKRPEVKYLPWEAAWFLLKNNCPHATYSHGEDLLHDDGTVEVEVHIDAAPLVGFARLAVMNQSFYAIKNPDARQVNDARQRCLVKAIAFTTGIGLSLWTNDKDIPVGDREDTSYITAKQAKMLTEMLGNDEDRLVALLDWAGEESLEELPQSKFAEARKMLGGKS